MESRPRRTHYRHNDVIGTVNNIRDELRRVPTYDRELRAPRTLEQYTRDYRCNLLIQNLAHDQSEQAGLVLQQESSVVRMPGKVE
ncbi:hypothetical protein X777_12159 [Ooceraea biroi]|uniref:Uncharacterized protein n=1 Tax=Ooceraea biroi TaxID=2015173 RepID=A0A026W3K3_OOCBI|nr:hypothetical protein X777_12159 [Ooceraea biroi]